jgi:hypothetical protein
MKEDAQLLNEYRDAYAEVGRSNMLPEIPASVLAEMALEAPMPGVREGLYSKAEQDMAIRAAGMTVPKNEAARQERFNAATRILTQVTGIGGVMALNDPNFAVGPVSMSVVGRGRDKEISVHVSTMYKNKSGVMSASIPITRGKDIHYGTQAPFGANGSTGLNGKVTLGSVPVTMGAAHLMGRAISTLGSSSATGWTGGSVWLGQGARIANWGDSNSGVGRDFRSYIRDQTVGGRLTIMGSGGSRYTMSPTAVGRLISGVRSESDIATNPVAYSLFKGFSKGKAFNVRIGTSASEIREGMRAFRQAKAVGRARSSGSLFGDPAVHAALFFND